MVRKLTRGATSGLLLALLIILSQPFYPQDGLIPELASFLTTVPLWIVVLILPHALVTPIAEGIGILIYFMALGAIVGIAFDRKPLWGWFFLIAVSINHYMVYRQLGRQMGEVVQTVLNYFS